MYCLKCNEWQEEGNIVCKRCGGKLSPDLDYYVKRYIEGDENVFHNIYQLSYQQIIYVIYKYTNVPRDVEDYLQEVYIHLLKKIKLYDANQAILNTCVATIGLMF